MPDDTSSATAPDATREEHIPRVSVGIPVYNGERYIRGAIESILAQDYTDFELLISDNGSTDGTQAICEELAARDSRIRYLREPENKGAAWNFDRLPHLARGEYFRWHCHDDLIAPTHLSTCVAALDRAPKSVIMVYTGTAQIDEDGNIVRTQAEGLDTRGMPPHARYGHFARHLAYVNSLYGLARRDLFLTTRLLGTYANADYVLMAELALAGEFWELPGNLFLRRVHSGMSRQANNDQESVAVWFDTSQKGRKLHFSEARLFKDLFVAVMRAPLNLKERALSLWAIPRYWARHRWRAIAREVAAPFSPRFRRYG